VQIFAKAAPSSPNSNLGEKGEKGEQGQADSGRISQGMISLAPKRGKASKEGQSIQGGASKEGHPRRGIQGGTKMPLRAIIYS
jgi:hypothetical protein